MSDEASGCLEAGEAGGPDVGVVEVTPESILPFDVGDLRMDEWAAKLDSEQRARYDIALDDSGEVELESLEPHLAYVRSLRGELVITEDIVRWLAEPPSPDQVAAAHLVTLADQRLEARCSNRCLRDGGSWSG